MLRPPTVANNAPMQTDSPKAAPPKRRRRWLQFSLRTLLLVMLAAGIAARSMTVKAEGQKSAVARIRQDGGSVKYDYQDRNIDSAGRWVGGAEPPGPAWLGRLLGDDYFVNVVDVQVASDAGLEQIGALGSLRNLYRRPVSGGRPRITDAGLKYIAGLTQLRWLCLDDTRITDAGLVYLDGLSELQQLDLAYMAVTDDGLKHLAPLSRLANLDLSGTEISGVGLQYLSGLVNLQHLDLSRSMVNDEGLDRVGRLRSLRRVSLAGAIQISDEGVSKLKKALPNCEIQR